MQLGDYCHWSDWRYCSVFWGPPHWAQGHGLLSGCMESSACSCKGADPTSRFSNVWKNQYETTLHTFSTARDCVAHVSDPTLDWPEKREVSCTMPSLSKAWGWLDRKIPSQACKFRPSPTRFSPCAGRSVNWQRMSEQHIVILRLARSFGGRRAGWKDISFLSIWVAATQTLLASTLLHPKVSL